MSFSRVVFFNQVVGKLFYQLVLELSSEFKLGGIVIYGNICKRDKNLELKNKLKAYKSFQYRRHSNISRLISWALYCLDVTRYIFLLRKRDLLIISSNPPILQIWIFLYLYFRKISYIILIYDIYPEILVSRNYLKSKNIIVRIWSLLNKKIYNNAYRVVTISHGMYKAIYKNYSLNKKNIAVITPWSDLNEIKPLSKKLNPYYRKFVKKGSFVVFYSGNMGTAHDIETILKAALMLKNKVDIYFLMIGGGSKFEYANEFITKNNLENVGIFPFQKEEILPYTFSLADISLVAIEQGCENLLIPSKTFDYLAAGSSIIAITQEPSDLSSLIKKEKIGFVVPPQKPDLLFKYILNLYLDQNKISKFKSNSRKIAEKFFSKKMGINKFNNLIENHENA